MFMNSNSLPVALMQSLIFTIPALKWDSEDNNNAMTDHALTYLLVYSTIGMVLRWSVGCRLLIHAEPEREGNADVEETSALVRPEMSALDLEPGPSSRRSYNWFPKSLNHSGEHLVLDPSLPEQSCLKSEEVTPLMQHAEPELPQHGRSSYSLTHVPCGPTLDYLFRCLHRAGVVANGFMTAPLWAALASSLVACVSPLKLAFKDHMFPVQTALSNAGNCSIPTTLVVLGAYFYRSAPEKMNSVLDGREKEGRSGRKRGEPAAYPGETKTVVIAVVSRMILTPLFLPPLMALCAQIDWQPVFNDRNFSALVHSAPAHSGCSVGI
ncbi:Auxin efflux carrier [Mycena venus]|uniref:Auxin efflux carrier n=1 Tax=Mycena venus TaxID=2733690 RepID=A0A8H6X6A5_9AGAR|nr:Auxin efflux carrier [Mycena venus]